MAWIQSPVTVVIDYDKHLLLNKWAWICGFSKVVNVQQYQHIIFPNWQQSLRHINAYVINGIY